jgi:glycosyltransferase involved in cell wall biosynthesis
VRKDREERLRVLVVSGLYPRPDDDTCGQFVHRQVVALRDRGLDARVLSPVARPLVPFPDGAGREVGSTHPEARRIDGVPVVYAPYRHVPHALSARLEAALFLRSLREHAESVFSDGPDVVHGFWLFPMGYGSARLAEELGLPSVVTALGSDVHTYPERHRGTERLSRSALRRADLSLAVSRDLERQMRRLADAPVRTDVVYNGLDSERFHPPEDRASTRRRLGLPGEGRGICFVGRLVEEKGTRELMEAFGRLARTRSDLWLSVVGDGPLEDEVRGWARKERFSGRVFVPGRVPQEEVAEWMRAADLFTLPSYAEGLPNVVMEAMACGLPAVATDVGGISEIDDDRRALRLVPPRQVEPLVAALETTLDGGRELREAVVAASRRVRERFTWERTARRLHEHYAGLVQRRRASADGSPADDGSGRPGRARAGRGT